MEVYRQPSQDGTVQDPSIKVVLAWRQRRDSAFGRGMRRDSKPNPTIYRADTSSTIACNYWKRTTSITTGRIAMRSNSCWMATVVRPRLLIFIMDDFLLYQAAWCATLLMRIIICSVMRTSLTFKVWQVHQWWGRSALRPSATMLEILKWVWDPEGSFLSYVLMLLLDETISWSPLYTVLFSSQLSRLSHSFCKPNLAQQSLAYHSNPYCQSAVFLRIGTVVQHTHSPARPA